ncbi:MAG: hypothetical protein A2Y10_01560 [Planctomycetes bacterium GWF2_41_51]|nr:MAG: hypothetical protein A2Y10_01560 [Planctomycetes bacterium GWF2_41_51]HBG25469.1 hypothetical protein [Phycisphaerales bacterium]
MKLCGVITSCLLLCTCSILLAQKDYSVLVQESPAGAGEIKPGIGVHTFGDSETVTLNTVAKRGYHFVTWLGDVHDPAANRTQLTVDGPKIVIAVFERDEYEALEAAGPQISVGPPGLYARSDTYTNSNSVNQPPDDYDPPDYPPWDPPDDPPNDPPPVPEIPEPATVMLLISGTYIHWINKRKRK